MPKNYFLENFHLTKVVDRNNFLKVFQNPQISICEECFLFDILLSFHSFRI